MVGITCKPLPIPQPLLSLSIFLHLWWELGIEINPASHHRSNIARLGGGHVSNSNCLHNGMLLANWGNGQTSRQSNDKNTSRTSQLWISKIYSHLLGIHLHPGWSNCNWCQNISNSGVNISKTHLDIFTIKCKCNFQLILAGNTFQWTLKVLENVYCVCFKV